MTKNYKWTKIKRVELFHTPAWANLEELMKAYPEAVEVGKEWSEALIQNDIKQREWMKENPGKYPPIFCDFKGKRDYKDEWGNEWMIIENHIAQGLFNKYFENTEAYKDAEFKTHQQIDAVYDELIQDPGAVSATRDNTHDNYKQWLLNKKIEKAEQRARR